LLRKNAKADGLFLLLSCSVIVSNNIASCMTLSCCYTSRSTLQESAAIIQSSAVSYYPVSVTLCIGWMVDRSRQLVQKNKTDADSFLFFKISSTFILLVRRC